MPELYIGLISGTSMDGIDAALVDFQSGQPQLVDFFYQAFDNTLKANIQAISRPDTLVSLLAYGQLDSQLGRLFGETALALLAKAGISASNIQAIGSHGQTVYHAPAAPDGFSLQIGDPNRIAQLTGITTVADLRRRDIAVGGEGAPLVPAFHQAVFADAGQARTLINIGGIANITVLDGKSISGFDTGPGNVFLDYWCQRHLQQPYDQAGAWGAGGQVQTDLLAVLHDDAYFQLPPPKSTGKEYFCADWLERKLIGFSGVKPVDVQATLVQLTADSISNAIRRYAPQTELSLVCGGGAYNHGLMTALGQNLDGAVATTAGLGIAADHVEAMAFAWLARQTLHQSAGNICSVTGATAPVILGGIYPGNSPLSG